MITNGLTFNLGSAKVCPNAILEAYFSYNKDIWIAATGMYHIYVFT